MEPIKLTDFVIVFNNENQNDQLYLRDILNKIEEQKENLNINFKEKINSIIYEKFFSSEKEKERIFNNPECLAFEIINNMNGFNLLSKLNLEIFQNEYTRMLKRVNSNLIMDNDSNFDLFEENISNITKTDLSNISIENLSDMDFLILSDEKNEILFEDNIILKNEIRTPNSVIK